MWCLWDLAVLPGLASDMKSPNPWGQKWNRGFCMRSSVYLRGPLGFVWPNLRWTFFATNCLCFCHHLFTVFVIDLHASFLSAGHLRAMGVCGVMGQRLLVLRFQWQWKVYVPNVWPDLHAVAAYLDGRFLLGCSESWLASWVYTVRLLSVGWKSWRYPGWVDCLTRTPRAQIQAKDNV